MSFPQWAREFSEKYRSGAFSMFVLHGNVHDVMPRPRPEGVEFLPLRRFLEAELFAQRDLVLTYDRGTGLHFGTPETQKDFQSALTGYDSFHGTRYAHSGLPRNPDGVLNLLDNYLRLRLNDGRKIALMIDFAETLAPAGDVGGMNAEDRNALVILKRWAHHPLFLRSDITIVLITENLIELNQGILQHPGVSAIDLDLPDAGERMAVIEEQMRQTPLPEGSVTDANVLASLTSGLKRIQLQNLVRHSSRNRLQLTLAELASRKKQFIEAESGGMLEFVQPKWNLGMVAGSAGAKQKLIDASQAIRTGRTGVLPMGYLICGPVGTGKTFLATCFAGEIGIPAVTLKNFRSMWQGVTEGNLERVLALLKAMSPIVVIVDEADAQLGDRSSSGDSGVNNRVFAQIAQFMGNTENRGKVIWFLLTCRPDLLPVDLKRQGRAEEHLALFYPEAAEDRSAMLQAMLKKTGTKLAAPEEGEALFQKQAGSFSGADIEALLVRARMRASLENRDTVSTADLSATLGDFVPASSPDEVELQTLVAVLECTSRSLLPAKYRSADRSAMVQRAAALKALTGG
jgi:AAA+ superfamily predicted ATPase